MVSFPGVTSTTNCPFLGSGHPQLSTVHILEILSNSRAEERVLLDVSAFNTHQPAGTITKKARHRHLNHTGGTG